MLDFVFILSLITGIFVASAASYLGSFMVLRRMALVGDAFTHIALPGMGIAFLLQANPFVGAFVFLAFGAFAIWFLEHKTKIYTEALVGVIFTLGLALGILITPEPELFEALFGNISEATILGTIISAGLALAVLILIFRISRQVMMGIISEDFAKANGVKIEMINLFFLIMVAVITALGIKIVGALLMGALVIIPPAAAKNLSRSLNEYGVLSVVFGVASVVLGLFASKIFGFPSGPMVVLTSALIFFLSFLRFFFRIR
ncbi:MAG: hypothetical protein A3H02_00870 [Candidatus Niyogibacteria bacterium RIFCSPLOWO2_12_FULL_41_13]|uniref:ABC transporter n=1 Tax=Candidatus Niyogibacteria bacterium RIFCSPLOWO2_12_FULL_41_13 TaxID=1801726 RepID=A0A1G2F3W3_9BACT|nr:MAG: hypothetical protein A3H02_00870 [Candidatus Niyogibacteria bacterium RIFCSPLOWO2_12_FULL_41_13]